MAQIADTRKSKILIAEDDVVSRRMLEAFASKRGYDVVSAANGPDALSLLSAAGGRAWRFSTG